MKALVFHAKNPTFRLGGHEEVTGVKDQDFLPVALVDVGGIRGEDALEIAFERTNHIDCAWWENEDVILVADPKQRSTSVGDLVQLGADYFLVDSFGWKKTTLLD